MGTNIKLWANDNGSWVALTEGEAAAAKQWIQEQGTRVYIKDFFDCSISLGERTVGNVETELGTLFSAAKYNDVDNKAKGEVLGRLRAAWDGMKSLPRDGYISAPPAREGKEFDLPTALAERLAKHTGLTFVPLGKWKGDKGQLKEVPADKKWDHLSSVGFEVNPTIVKSGKPVLLIDDIYQSGTTLNFLRASLTGMGIARSSAISIVKAARDTDNQ
jgi:predicted amidophosphoribosyltransferase